MEGALALSWGEWRGVGGRVVGGRDGARRRGIGRGGREALKGGPQSVLSPKGWQQRPSRRAGKLLCSEGSAGEKSARNWAWWEKERALERGKREVERQGAGARPRASSWGAPLRTRLYWGMGAKGRGGYWEGEEGKVPRCSRQRWVCAGGDGKDGGPEGEKRKLVGEDWGRWRGRLGNQ